MKAYVFTDRSLERFAGQFVWLAIDTEKPANAWFRDKFALEGLPSFYVVDARTEQVALRWLGSATTAQLATIFADGQSAVTGSGSPLEKARARADKLYAEKKNADAAKAYQETLKLAPAAWPGFGRTSESLLFALMMSDQVAECVATATQAYPKVHDSASAMTIASLGLDCALTLPKETVERAALISSMEKIATETLANPKVRVAADDRSGLYLLLISARDDSGDPAGKRRLTEQWASFLEAEARKAPSAEARAVFDSHRLSAYRDLDQPERAVEMLKASERDLPEDYNPPARLAAAFRAMKRYDEALAASDRALAKAYGPRKVGILSARAEIYQDKGDRAASRRTLEEALRLAESMAKGQRSESTISSLKKKLGELDAKTTVAGSQ